MGTTLTAARAGSFRYTLVAAIEGYEKLLTDGDTAAVVTAWAGTEWSEAQAGLVAVGDFAQRMNPWNAFTDGGSLTLHVLEPADSTATLAIAIAKNDTSTEGLLNADWSASSVTPTLISTTDLASSGTAYCGTERFTYAGKTATTLTGCTRGRYAPFGTNSGAANRFGHAHRATDTAESTIIRPIISQDPRVWVGRWVGLWMHRNVDGVLDTKAQAQCLFAGKIVEIRDDPNTGATVLDVQHVCEIIGDATVGRDAWTAELAEGVHIAEGERFQAQTGPSWSSGNDLVCTVGASGAYQFEPGYYSAAQLCTTINLWLSTLGTNATFASPVPQGGTYRTVVQWAIPGAGPTDPTFLEFRGPANALQLLGWTPKAYSSSLSKVDAFRGLGPGLASDTSEFSPILYSNTMAQRGPGAQFHVQNESGAPGNQSAYIPSGYQDWVTDKDRDGALTWIVFRLADAFFLASYAAGVLTNVTTLRALGSGEALTTGGTVRYGEGKPRPLLRQAYVLQGSFQSLIPTIFASTGSLNYNHSTYDKLPYSAGLGLPWGILGAGFVRSLRRLDGHGADLTLIIDKPTTIRNLLGGDLVMRRAGLVWKNEGVRFSSWQTPRGGTMQHTLTEANKASGAGTSDAGRSAVTTSDEWQRSTVKIHYNRDARTGEYRDSYTIQDTAAIDDAGGEDRPITIKLPNAYARLGNDAEETVSRLVRSFLANLPLFSRTARLLTRSIDFRSFEAMAPGDTVSLTDNFARDPLTGLRGITNAPALVISHRCDWGGVEPGDPSSLREPVGEVTLMLVDRDRSGRYSPSGQVDKSYTSGAFTNGYDSTNFKIRLVAQEHGDSGVNATADASFFQATDVVTIYEIDPATAASPQSWDRTISAVSGNDITLSSALSGYVGTVNYRMVSRTYSAATATQRLNAYQADSADAKVEDLVRPFTYGANDQEGTLDNADTQLPERHAALMYGDGKPVDAGAVRGLIRMVNNLKRTKTKVNSPRIYSAALTGSPTTGTWDLISWSPIRVPMAEGEAGTRRLLRVAPMIRSTDGTSTQCRVSLSRFPPVPSSAADVDDDPIILSPSASATWTTTSVTYAEGAVASLDLGPCEENGIGWLIVEAKAKCQSWGLSKCYEARGGRLIHEADWCKNGDVPQAALEERLVSEMNGILRRPKVVFAWHGSYDWSLSTGSPEIRWRFKCHTSTHAKRFAIMWVIAPNMALDLLNKFPSATFYAKRVSAGTTTSSVIKVGAFPTGMIATQVPASECHIAVTYLDCTSDEDYECYFETDDYCRLVGATVYEAQAALPTRADMLVGGFASTAPIYNYHREVILPVATNAWKRNGGHLFNWCVSADGSQRTTTGTTSKNLVDTAVTTVSAASPGFTIDLEYCSTLSSVTVPCVFAAYGSKTNAGNATVTLKDSAGATVATVTITTGAAAAWYSTTVNLPATIAKYDVHFVSAAAGTLSIGAVSLYQYLA